MQLPAIVSSIFSALPPSSCPFHFPNSVLVDTVLQKPPTVPLIENTKLATIEELSKFIIRGYDYLGLIKQIILNLTMITNCKISMVLAWEHG